ncbi:hypothetical protein E2C01_044512 [Portunus trituberculatus]|uniref:Uncharacterized protein n=1 Tax=Portunus trituberculatus TaxID=210409 RepID=A0A5B7G096_PORTR|nr:hypothetical protein [Portunus trituberculatus]
MWRRAGASTVLAATHASPRPSSLPSVRPLTRPSLSSFFFLVTFTITFTIIVTIILTILAHSSFSRLSFPPRAVSPGKIHRLSWKIAWLVRSICCE